MQEELLSVVGKDRLPKLTDQPYLPYTCAVVMETHRMASVFPFLLPHSVTEETQFQGEYIFFTEVHKAKKSGTCIVAVS